MSNEEGKAEDAHRQNHFNFLRILLAAGVLLSHSFPLTAGQEVYDAEPWFVFTHGQRLLGTTCVLGFFVISGYLVSESFQRAVGLRDYFAARILRIYPAAIACALVSALIIGPFVSSLPMKDYYADSHVWQFVARTGTFLGTRTLLTFRIKDWLPNVFEGNPLPGAVNGSIWTIPWELLCYLLLIPAGQLLYRSRSALTRKMTLAALALTALTGCWQYALRELPLAWSGPIVFWGFFSIGILARSLLVESTRPRWLTWIALVGFVGIERFEHYAPAMAIASPFLLAYVLLSASTQLPKSWLTYNRLGDFSYGLYLYGWPVQQTIIYLQPGIGPWRLFATALVVAVALAALSWHLLEKRALRLKRKFVRRKPYRQTEQIVSQT